MNLNPFYNMLRESRHSYEGGAVRFNPVDNPELHGTRDNPYYDDQYKHTFSARLIVGFNVGVKTVFTMSDIIKLVKKARKDQTGFSDSTFIAQKGFYTYEGEGKYKGKVTREPGAQVIIFNVGKGAKPLRTFRKHIMELSVYICKVMKQEKVITDFYEDGLQMEPTHIVGWYDKADPSRKPLKTSLK